MKQEKIYSFAKSTLGQWQDFNLGLHLMDLSELSGIVDIYYGYAATPILSAKNSSEFVGASYRVVFS
jgi:hypothetical protein